MFWRGFCLALLLPLLAGCQSINRLREAQDAFSQGATLDLKTAFPPDAQVNESVGTEQVSQWASARNYYASALLSLERIDPKDEKTLRDEKLWGTKLTLEALCHWKLGNYDKALKIARDAQSTDQLFPRDKAVIQALPGLVMIDYAYDLRPQAEAAKHENRGQDLTNIVSKIEQLTVSSGGAVDVIEAARAPHIVDSNHPVHVYLIQAQLAAYRDFRKGYELLEQTGVPPSHPAHIRAQAQLNDLAKRVGPTGQALVNRWAGLDNLTPPQPQSHE